MDFFWKPGDIARMSELVLNDVDFGGEDYPKQIETKNDNLARMMHPVPGILEIQSIYEDEPPLIITGGIHGDEKAGVVVIDRLVRDIIVGEIPVRRHVLLMFGNLQAMKANGFEGARCIESEAGELSNLNRCFGRGVFSNPKCYAQRRANEMTRAVERFVNSYGCPEAIDIHQSFSVPSLYDVREGVADRSDYTYAMLYPIGNDVQGALSWIHKGYSDIVAGVVLNDMTLSHHTFAGYMACVHGAHAATFEQGSIGFVDYDTFTPQLEENLARKIAGEVKLEATQGFDVWRCVRGFKKESNDFRFIDANGRIAQSAPVDFLPLHEGTVARDGEAVHDLSRDERLLFANPDVPIGDRAAVVIERFETELVPTP